MHVLITGGLGFIGCHASIVLPDTGYKVTILDNLSNSNIKTLLRIKKVTNNVPEFIKGDVRIQSSQIFRFIGKNLNFMS